MNRPAPNKTWGPMFRAERKGDTARCPHCTILLKEMEEDHDCLTLKPTELGWGNSTYSINQVS